MSKHTSYDKITPRDSTRKSNHDGPIIDVPLTSLLSLKIIQKGPLGFDQTTTLKPLYGLLQICKVLEPKSLKVEGA